MMLSRRHQQAMPQFDRRLLLAFPDPIGVRLKERKHLVGRLLFSFCLYPLPL